MHLVLERPDYVWFLRGADGRSALVNQRRLTASFVIAPDVLYEDWPVRDAGLLAVSDLAPLLARRPELIVLGTGAVQVFPPQATLAACLQQGVGIEVMNNESAARTYSVLAGDGRAVIAGFILPG